MILASGLQCCFILYTVYCILYTLYCILYTVYFIVLRTSEERAAWAVAQRSAPPREAEALPASIKYKVLSIKYKLYFIPYTREAESLPCAPVAVPVPRAVRGARLMYKVYSIKYTL